MFQGLLVYPMLYASRRSIMQFVHYAIFSNIGTPRRVDCLAPSWVYSRLASFPSTQQRVLSSVDIELATLRLVFGSVKD